MKSFLLLACIIMVFIGGGVWIGHISANKNVIKLVAFGDSITHGSGDPSRNGYIERFRVQFEKNRGTPVSLNNFGIPKYTTNDILQQLKSKEVRQTIKKADMIVLYVGTNDFRISARHDFAHIDVNRLNEGRR